MIEIHLGERKQTTFIKQKKKKKKESLPFGQKVRKL